VLIGARRVGSLVALRPTPAELTRCQVFPGMDIEWLCTYLTRIVSEFELRSTSVTLLIADFLPLEHAEHFAQSVCATTARLTQQRAQYLAAVTVHRSGQVRPHRPVRPAGAVGQGVGAGADERSAYRGPIDGSAAGALAVAVPGSRREAAPVVGRAGVRASAAIERVVPRSLGATAAAASRQRLAPPTAFAAAAASTFAAASSLVERAARAAGARTALAVVRATSWPALAVVRAAAQSTIAVVRASVALSG